ncbi:hypothetical protein BH18ACI4_BH18ACI4_01310 [soil metagenome]
MPQLHWPKCHGDQTALAGATTQRLLPCPYFLVTFTLPAELHPLALANQKKVYGLMMLCAGATGAGSALYGRRRYSDTRVGLVLLSYWTWHSRVFSRIFGSSTRM